MCSLGEKHQLTVRWHDTHHNDIQHIDTQHEGLTYATQHYNALSLFCVLHFNNCYAECKCAVCGYIECRGAE
jgi:hypothetical protein